MQSQVTLPRRAQRGSSCHHCRRMKLRCDAPTQFPAPCTRCSRANRVCSLVAPTHDREQRQPNHQSHRIAQLEKDLRDLRESLQTGWPAPTLAASGTPQSDVRETMQSASEIAVECGIDLLPISIGNVEIVAPHLLELIDVFFEHFHPQLPFLTGKAALVTDCATCPLLSWAVVAVASRAFPHMAEIRARLVWPVRRLAAESVLQPKSLPVIQALLLLCLWPMPYAALVDDPSWSLAGIALQKALQLKLYQPLGVLLQQVGGDTGAACARQLTWVACFIVHQMLCDRFSIPTTTSLDPSIIATSMPPVLGEVAEAARKDSVISSIISQHMSSNGPKDLFPLLEAMESELHTLEARFRTCPSPLLARLLASIKLRLYSLAYTRLSSVRPNDDETSTNGNPAGSSDNDLRTATYVSKAFTLAMQLMTAAVDEDSMADPDAPSRPCGLWTFIDLQSFILGLFTVIKLSRNAEKVLERAQVSDTIQHACTMLKSCSVVDGDHFYRVHEIIAYLADKTAAAATNNVVVGTVPDSEEAIATTSSSSVMGVGVANELIKEAQKRYRRRRRFPEEFPEALTDQTGLSDFGANESEGSSDDLLQSMLSRGISTDFDFMMWPSWGGGQGNEHTSQTWFGVHQV